jgi:hypothetical protein
MLKKSSFFIFAGASAAIFVSAALYTNNSRALDSTSQLTGECGGVFSMIRKNFVADDGNTVDVMMYINFDTKKISISSTQINVPNGYDGIDFNKQVSYTTRSPRASEDFTIDAGPIAKSFKIKVTAGGMPDLIIMPVSGGNTILVQAVDENVVGMCQKL